MRLAAIAIGLLWLAAPASAECIELNGVHDVVIENRTIGPCPDSGIEIFDSQRITIRNVTFKNLGDEAVYAFNVDGLTVVGSSIEDAESGIVVVKSKAIKVDNNTFLNMRGPIPSGQFVQFNTVTGPGNRVSCNVMRNVLGEGRRPEDAISLYRTVGTSTSPVMIQRNKIIGGGPSESGGGIMLGDDGGRFQTAADNVLVDPGQYGVAISSGDHHRIMRNRIFAKRQSFTNVGIYVWNQYPHACNSHRVSGNKVNWTNAEGQKNGFWDGENCGPITMANNNFNAPITASIGTPPIPNCPTP